MFATAGAQAPPAVASFDGFALCPAASVITHPETRGRPGLLGDHTELGGAEAHVFAEERAHLHLPNEAVTAVQHGRHCSHRERRARGRPWEWACCPCPPEAQPELRARSPAQHPDQRGRMGACPDPCSHSWLEQQGQHPLGTQASARATAWPWGLWSQSQLPACTQLKRLVREGASQSQLS